MVDYEFWVVVAAIIIGTVLALLLPHHIAEIFDAAEAVF